jgi:hypothetical protein
MGHFSLAPRFTSVKQCGLGVDKRDLGAAFYHEVPGHKPLPEN